MSIVMKQLRTQKSAAQPVRFCCALIMNVIPEACEGIRLLSRCNVSASVNDWVHCVNTARSLKYSLNNQLFIRYTECVYCVQGDNRTRGLYSPVHRTRWCKNTNLCPQRWPTNQLHLFQLVMISKKLKGINVQMKSLISLSELYAKQEATACSQFFLPISKLLS